MNHGRSLIDLRSDTVTKPTSTMLAAMLEAPVGDDVYGEDPSINALEQKVALLVGKGAALFVPSGTMANQIALHIHTRPGDSIIAETDSHCFAFEAGAAAAQSGVQFDLIPRSHELSEESIADRIRPEGLGSATTTLLVVENTHNRGGGRYFVSKKVEAITRFARKHNLLTHCDGARLWNAAAAAQESEAALAAGFDSVAVCFSKGLGAPVGSALCGTTEFIEKARKVRKRWGGGMRQCGYLAAAAAYALDHHRHRLPEDHQKIKIIAEALSSWGEKTGTLQVDCPKQPTNILYFRLTDRDGDQLAKEFNQHGLLLHHLGKGWLRIVTHLHITDDQVARAIEVFKQVLKVS